MCVDVIISIVIIIIVTIITTIVIIFASQAMYTKSGLTQVDRRSGYHVMLHPKLFFVNFSW